jgi:IS1 transposase
MGLPGSAPASYKRPAIGFKSRQVHLLAVRPAPAIPHAPTLTYPNAVDGAFGGAVNYGTLIKDYTESEQPGRYGPPIMTGATRNVIQGDFHKAEICTSHVERHNLTIRTFMRRFTRLALGFSKKLEPLAACISLYIAHYNYCRMHGSLPGTPAMAARLTGHPWTMDELFDAE